MYNILIYFYLNKFRFLTNTVIVKNITGTPALLLWTPIEDPVLSLTLSESLEVLG